MKVFTVKKKTCLKVILCLLALLIVYQAAPIYNKAATVYSQNNGGGVSDWGLSFGNANEQPKGNAEVDYLKQFDTYYMGNANDKIIYLTFDAGYENGFTAQILDVLKQQEVPATFFLVKHYLETEPDLVKRMAAEGHIVGNHTATHPDMSKISTYEALKAELEPVEQLYQKITGQEMKKYYRPPQGKFQEANLKDAQQMGYKTFFWSLAYADWDVNKQPKEEDAIEKLCSRIHPGAVVLLHSTSETNAKILDRLISKWKEMGYTFQSLDDFIAKETTNISTLKFTLPQINNPASNRK